MANLNIKAAMIMSGKYIETGLPLIAFEEDGVTIVYSPALDLNGSGYDLNQAKASFWESLTEFLRYTVGKGTLMKELERLGWKIKGKKNDRRVKAPDFSDLLKSNKEFEQIVTNKEFRKFNETIQIPQFA